MHISEVRPPLPGLNHSVVDIQIAIFLLRCLDHIDELADRAVDLGVVLIRQEVASALDPFGDVAVPEKMERHRPHGLVVVDGVPLQLETVVSACGPNLVELGADGRAGDGCSPGREQRLALEGRLAKGDLRMRHGWEALVQSRVSRSCRSIEMDGAIRVLPVGLGEQLGVPVASTWGFIWPVRWPTSPVGDGPTLPP